MTEFERIIKEAVLNKHYTISEFCTEVGLSRQGFYNLCNGVNFPSEETIIKINSFLGTTFVTEIKRRSKPSGHHKSKTETTSIE